MSNPNKTLEEYIRERVDSFDIVPQAQEAWALTRQVSVLHHDVCHLLDLLDKEREKYAKLKKRP